MPQGPQDLSGTSTHDDSNGGHVRWVGLGRGSGTSWMMATMSDVDTAPLPRCRPRSDCCRRTWMSSIVLRAARAPRAWPSCSRPLCAVHVGKRQQPMEPEHVWYCSGRSSSAECHLWAGS